MYSNESQEISMPVSVCPALPSDADLKRLVAYAALFQVEETDALRAARYCLLDGLAQMLEALANPAARMPGPLVPGAFLPGGARVPGTGYELDPAQAAFNLGILLGSRPEPSGYPSYPPAAFAALLAAADYVGRRAYALGKPPLLMREVLEALAKACEMRLELSHLPALQAECLAGAAAAAMLLGAKPAALEAALREAWISYRPAQPLPTAREYGAAARQALLLALQASQDTSSLAAGSYSLKPPALAHAVTQVWLDLGLPAPLPAQTAIEAACLLSPAAQNRLGEIDRVVLETHTQSGGLLPPQFPASVEERRRCLRYLTAVGLLQGRIEAADLRDQRAADPRLHQLWQKIQPVVALESPSHAIQIFYQDASASRRVLVAWPLGHPHRRSASMRVLIGRFAAATRAHLPGRQCATLLQWCGRQDALADVPAHEFIGLLSLPSPDHPPESKL
jgi:2-methylcitrate dehydratase